MKVGTFIKGLLLVLVGITFFLINMGYGSWDSIQQISKWWPILLIILGLSLFGQGRLPRWIAYGLIVMSVVAVGAYMVLVDHPNHRYDAATESALTINRQQYPQVKEGNLSIDYGGGKLLLMPGTQALLKGDFTGAQTNQGIVALGENLKVDLSQTEHSVSWSTWQKNNNRWQLQISPELYWNLDIDAGAIDGSIDLRGIPFKQMNCDVGAGNMDFILGNNGKSSKIDIDAGASNIKLQIPGDTGVRIKLEGALMANNLDKLGWIKTEEGYTSPNYQQATSKIDCDIELAAGNLEVKMVR